MRSSRDILKESKLMDELKKGKIRKEDRAKKHILLDKLLDGCFIHPLTNSFYCKKCKCVVTVDWNKNEAFCVVDGLICACVSDEDLKEPVTITQDGKVWMLLGKEEEVE